MYLMFVYTSYKKKQMSDMYVYVHVYKEMWRRETHLCKLTPMQMKNT